MNSSNVLADQFQFHLISLLQVMLETYNVLSGDHICYQSKLRCWEIVIVDSLALEVDVVPLLDAAAVERVSQPGAQTRQVWPENRQAG